MGLGDELHAASETIWEAIKKYDYSEEYKEEIVNSLAGLLSVIYKVDRDEKDQLLTKQQLKKMITRRWIEERQKEE